MNKELLDRLKAEPGVPGMTLMLIAEIERLEAQNRALVDAMRRVVSWADRYEYECPFCEMWDEFDVTSDDFSKHEADCLWPVLRAAMNEGER